MAELQRGMASGRFTAAALVRHYLKRIAEVDRKGPRLKAVIELNPDALEIAEALDRSDGNVVWRSDPVVSKAGYYTNASAVVAAGALFMGFSPADSVRMAHPRLSLDEST